MAVDRTEILRGVDLAVGEGELHALMGPNGSGKSTLANTLLGNPSYRVTAGAIRFRGEDVTSWPPDVRAKAGMFLAFQYPEEIAGVPVIQFLRQAMSARRVGEDRSVLEVRMEMLDWMKRLGMDPAFGERHLNEGFSGGEKKRNEILQMAMLEPELAVLDETDSGLDIDALARRGRRCPGRARRARLARGARRHPLHADPRAARGPTACTCSWTAGSWSGGAGARAAARVRGVRAMAEVTVTSPPSRPTKSPVMRQSDRARLDVRRCPGSRATSRCSSRTVHGHRLVYLDSASSSQRPQSRARRHGPLLRDQPCQRPPRGLHDSPRRRTASTSRRASTSAGSSGRPIPSTR